jgi:hypothetical protein
MNAVTGLEAMVSLLVALAGAGGAAKGPAGVNPLRGRVAPFQTAVVSRPVPHGGHE